MCQAHHELSAALASRAVQERKLLSLNFQQSPACKKTASFENTKMTVQLYALCGHSDGHSDDASLCVHRPLLHTKEASLFRKGVSRYLSAQEENASERGMQPLDQSGLTHTQEVVNIT